MDNYELVTQALLQQFSPSVVSQFMTWAEQDPHLSALIERNPQRAIILCAEILRIARGES